MAVACVFHVHHHWLYPVKHVGRRYCCRVHRGLYRAAEAVGGGTWGECLVDDGTVGWRKLRHDHLRQSCLRCRLGQLPHRWR